MGSSVALNVLGLLNIWVWVSFMCYKVKVLRISNDKRLLRKPAAVTFQGNYIERLFDTVIVVDASEIYRCQLFPLYFHVSIDFPAQELKSFFSVSMKSPHSMHWRLRSFCRRGWKLKQCVYTVHIPHIHLQQYTCVKFILSHLST